MKKPRRRVWQKKAQSKTAGLKRGAQDLALCEDFRKRLMEGGTVKEVAQAMGLTMRTAYRWAVDVRLAASEWLRREGFNEGQLIRMWLAQAKRSRGHVHNGALRELGELLDAYPAKKPPEPPRGPVTVIFNTKIENYKEAQSAPRKVIEQGSV